VASTSCGGSEFSSSSNSPKDAYVGDSDGAGDAVADVVVDGDAPPLDSGKGGSSGADSDAQAECETGDGNSPCVCVPSNGGIEICDGLDNDCDGTADEDETRVEEVPYTIDRCCTPPSSYFCCAPEYGGSESGKPGDCCTYKETKTTTVNFTCK
jgi:hypothetical protein